MSRTGPTAARQAWRTRYCCAAGITVWCTKGRTRMALNRSGQAVFFTKKGKMIASAPRMVRPGQRLQPLPPAPTAATRGTVQRCSAACGLGDPVGAGGGCARGGRGRRWRRAGEADPALDGEGADPALDGEGADPALDGEEAGSGVGRCWRRCPIRRFRGKTRDTGMSEWDQGFGSKDGHCRQPRLEPRSEEHSQKCGVAVAPARPGMRRCSGGAPTSAPFTPTFPRQNQGHPHVSMGQGAALGPASRAHPEPRPSTRGHPRSSASVCPMEWTPPPGGIAMCQDGTER